MVAFFFWFMLIWIFISIFADIFRRSDLTGGWKASGHRDLHHRSSRAGPHVSTEGHGQDVSDPGRSGAEGPRMTPADQIG
jgi:hypothetical protein